MGEVDCRDVVEDRVHDVGFFHDDCCAESIDGAGAPAVAEVARCISFGDPRSTPASSSSCLCILTGNH